MLTIGSTILVNRLSQNLSLNALSELSGVDSTIINRLEKGQIETSSKLSDIFNGLDIDFEIAQNATEYSHRLLMQIVEKAINIIDYSSDIEQLNSTYAHNCITVDLLLANLINIAQNNIIITENQIDTLFTILDKCDDILTPFEKKVKCIFMGLYYDILDQHAKAITFFEQASCIEYPRKLHALNQYYLARAYAAQFKLFKASNAITTAIRIFEEEGVYIRIISSILNQGNIAYFLHEYDSAKDYYKKAMDLSYQFQLSDKYVSICYSNIFNIYVEDEQFDVFDSEWNNLDNHLKNKLLNNEVFIINYIIFLYETENYTECKKIISQKESIIINFINQKIIDYFKQKITSQNFYDKPLRQAIKYMVKNEDYGSSSIIFRYIIKEYEQINDSENQLKYLKLYLKIKH